MYRVKRPRIWGVWYLIGGKGDGAGRLGELS